MQLYTSISKKHMDMVRGRIEKDSKTAYQLQTVSGVNSAVIHRFLKYPGDNVTYPVFLALADAVGLVVTVEEKSTAE